MKVELVLGIWGSVISSILAIKQIWDWFRDRADVVVSIAMVYDTVAEGSDTHGVLFLDESGSHPLWKNADVEVFISNRGHRPCQIAYVLVEFDQTLFLVTPEPLPMILERDCMIAVRVQPELLAMRDTVNKSQRDDPPRFQSPLAIGVIDGLGRKWFAPEKQLNLAAERARALPLRYEAREDHEPGKIAFGIQWRDHGRFFNKEEDFKPVPSRRT